MHASSSAPLLPSLCLVDELLHRGYEALLCPVTHAPDGPKVFDSRRAAHRASYLRCVIAFGDLVKKGLESMPGIAANVYYDVLLKTGTVPAPRLPAAEPPAWLWHMLQQTTDSARASSEADASR